MNNGKVRDFIRSRVSKRHREVEQSLGTVTQPDVDNDMSTV